ncbi:PAS domain S-box protein [Flammeovirgaceae bacterium SG7u.111]|nr:PAS domain S-box protein [Flammeovirgaceae bacterium SG7u.132]WPO35657.1 PAS domain S-box protein [Flammeovirgaceae bacterium SG7u.111]
MRHILKPKVNLLLFETIVDGWEGLSIIKNSKGEILAANSTFADFFGFRNTKELQRRSEQEIFTRHFGHTKLDLDHDNYFILSLPKGEKINQRIELTSPDGNPLHFSLKKFPVFDETNNPVAIACIYTPLRNYNGDEKRQLKFGQIFENSLFEIFVFDAQEHKFTYLSKGALKNTGYSKREIVEKTPLNLLNKEVESEFRDALVELKLGHSKLLVYEASINRKDGSSYRAEVQLQYMHKDSPPSYIAMVQDITERAISEDTIRKLNNAVKYSPSAIVITDKHGVIEYVNPRFTEVTGYIPTEVIGKTPRLLKSGKQPKDFYSNLWKTIADGQLWEGEFHNKKKSGELYWERAAIGPISDKDDKITHFVAIKEDVTDKKRINEELRKKEHIYRTLVEQLPNSGVFLFDKNLEYVLAEGPIIEQVNRKKEDFEGKHVSKTFRPDVLEDSLARYKKALQGEASYYETNTGGKDYKVSIVPLTDENGIVFLGMMVLQDITEQKKVENEVRANYQFLQTIIQTIPNPFFYKNTEGVYLDCNDSFARLLDLKREDIIGKNSKDILNEEQYKTLNYANNVLLLNKSNYVYEASLTIPKDGENHFIIHKAAVENHKKETVGIVGILHNVTFRKNSQTKLQESNKELKELNREKDSLMSIVAHDLKSPLSKVKGLANVIMLDNNLNEEQISYLKLINSVADNSEQLIRDLLDINTFEHSDSRIKLTELDVHQVIDELTDSYQQLSNNKGIRLEIEKDPNATKHTTDLDFLNRILDNLLSNAIKFSKQEKTVKITVSRPDTHLMVKVQDEGPGISEEDQTKMFKRFQKLSAQPTGGESSTGLGLSIIKVLVDRLKGEIDVDSQLNKGTTFTISIPEGKIR